METVLALDLIRGAHLLFIALGLGPAIYFDLRSLHRIAQPLTHTDIEELHRIHRIVSFACVGLWITGALLIGVRTGFDVAEFSPKLWSKLIVVTTLTANALILATFVIPAVSRYTGVRLIDLPVRLLLPMTICAGVSLSCWLLALALGSSQVLKTAGWDVLLSVEVCGAAICIFSVLTVMFGLRAILYRRQPAGRSQALNHDF